MVHETAPLDMLPLSIPSAEVLQAGSMLLESSSLLKVTYTRQAMKTHKTSNKTQSTLFCLLWKPLQLLCRFNQSDGSILLVVRVRSTLRSPLHNTHETSVVGEALLGTASQLLLFLSLRNLWSLVLHLTCTSQRTVNLAHGA
eukprot:TRINITY_DN246_c0_g1_i4.p1 TRINITY_DN246_c0_g1~~TRINITY_DN246_c0_g1_i4.p1  ORF type:complete len:142 (-),score=3.49 TRINITY_DN246_c0_g1_i4:131-556(-)